jgi:hypothetical protein
MSAIAVAIGTATPDRRTELIVPHPTALATRRSPPMPMPHEIDASLRNPPAQRHGRDATGREAANSARTGS